MRGFFVFRRSFQPLVGLSAHTVRCYGSATSTAKDDLMEAAKKIKDAEAIIITAGAGMGVDSGLPDFRGVQGLWKAYPPLKQKSLNFSGISNPRWFYEDAEFAWGFYGHRYNLYQRTDPHEGFDILKQWTDDKPAGYFIYTSNVDGHFQKAGFDDDRIVECHGSIHYLQCVDTRVSKEIWPVPDGTVYNVDDETLRMEPPLPLGPSGRYETLARPNILMFNDSGCIFNRIAKQEDRYFSFLMSLQRKGGLPFVVIEIGAGMSVSTVRKEGENLVTPYNKGTLVRINPVDSKAPKGAISLPMAGLEALVQLRDAINKL